MKRLYVFILKSFAGPFLFTLFVSMFVLLMSSIWRYVDVFAGRDLPVSVIIEFFAYYSVTTLFMAIPLAILLASIMTLGSMGEKYELIAMKSAGISLFRILKPLVFLVIALAFITFYITNNVIPVAMFKSKSLLSDMVDKNPEFLLKEGTFISDMPGATIKVERISKEDDGKFYDAIIYKNTPSGKIERTITAKSGKMLLSKDAKFMTIWLYDGNMYEEDDRNKSFPFTRTSFNEYMVITPMNTTALERTEKELNKQDYRMLTYQQLDTLITNVKQRKKDKKDLTYEGVKSGNFFRSMDRDSVFNYMASQTLDADSLFKSFPANDQVVILSSALGATKASKSYITSEMEYFNSLQTYIAKAEGYWHQKFSWSFACIIFFLVGASLGAIVRKGGFGMPVLLSIVMFIAYYMIDRYGLNYFVAKDYLPAYVGCWMATFIFLTLGIWLSYKATTDSALMDADIYKRMARRFMEYPIMKKVKSLLPKKLKV